MATDKVPDTSSRSTRYRNVSGRPLNRRVVLKSVAGLSAMALVGAATVAKPPVQKVSAQEIDGTRAREWIAADHVGTDVQPDADGWVTFQAEFPFWAIGVGWAASVGRWPVVELQFSADGESWSDIWPMATRVIDDGKLPDGGRRRASVDGERLFTDLVFTDGQEYIRYRTLDGEGNTIPQSAIAGLAITYIDPTDGPWEQDRARTMTRSSLTVANDDTNAPPTIITRAQWGADESLRFDEYGEIWPSEYQTVEHAIVHHAAANYGPDGYLAVRSIYYYHCVTQGWGDVGYNYLIDLSGNIYEGRVGGQNVIGGHAFEYAYGSSGICIMGDFRYEEASDASKAALVTILAFVTRDLDTYATKPFHEILDLPTICAHRDVNATTCPGQYLYDDLPVIRDQVAATLDAGDLDTGMAAGIVPGDQVKVQTDDGQPLNMRSGGGTSYPVNGSIPDGTLLKILLGPTTNSEGNWYQVEYAGTKGWVTAQFLIVTPPPPPEVPDGDFPFATNMRFTAETNVRTGAGTDKSILATVARNTWAFIMAGPVKASGYDWYQLRVSGVGDGWAIKDNLAVAPVNENPTAKFKVGDAVSAIRSTSIRVRPGAAQTVASTAAAGTPMQITLDPLETTGAIWYGVQGAFGGGWVVEADLQISTPPPTGDLKPGDTVRVTETLNMRSGAGTGYGIVATLAAGTTGNVLDGPRTANGYTWYQIQTSEGTGWVVRDWIVKITPPVAKFDIGDTVRVTETMNMRSGPGTGNSIVASLPAGTTGEVLDGPRTGSGYTWWRLRTNLGTGWAAEDWLVEETDIVAQIIQVLIRILEDILNNP